MTTGLKFVKYLDGKRIQGRNGYVNGIVGASADLTVTGATQNGNGKIGKCIDFDGSNDFATASGTTDFNFMHKGNGGKKPRWTVSFWLNTQNTTPSDTERLFGTSTGSDVGFCFKISEGGGQVTLLVHIVGTSGNYLARVYMPNMITTDTNWHHYVITYDHTIDEDAYNIWKDGTKIASNTASPSSANDRESTTASNSDQDHAFRIGGNADTGTDNSFRGQFDEMSFWNRVLTATEIEDELYDGTNAGITTTDAVEDLTGLKVFYNFNEASGNVKNVTTADIDDKTSITNIEANSTFEGIDDYYSYQRVGNEWLPRKITSPLEISDCRGWWDMSDTSYVDILSGRTTVHRIKDKSGNDFHLLNHGSTSYQPVVATNQQNSLQALRFITHTDSGGGAGGNYMVCKYGSHNTTPSQDYDTTYDMINEGGWTGTTPCTVFWVGNVRSKGYGGGKESEYYILDMNNCGRLTLRGEKWVTSDSTNTHESSSYITHKVDSSQDVIYHDLGKTAWLLRFSVKWTAEMGRMGDLTNNAYFYIMLSDNTSNTTTAQDSLEFFWVSDGNAEKVATTDSNGVTPESGAYTESNYNFVPTVGTTYYFELKRVSSTYFWGSLYSDSTYSTLSASAGSTLTSSGIVDLRYIKIASSSGTNSSGDVQIGDIKFWDGTTGYNAGNPVTITGAPVFEAQFIDGTAWRMTNGGAADMEWSDSTKGNYTVDNFAYLTMVFDNTNEGGTTGTHGNASLTEGSIFRCNGVETKISGLGETRGQGFTESFVFNDHSSYNGYGDYNVDQDVGELIIFQRRLKPAEILSVENYIKEKWDL